MTIKELREKRAKAWDDARDFLDSKRNDSGLLSEEDSKTYDDMEQQIVAYGKEIDRLERQEKLAREMQRLYLLYLLPAHIQNSRKKQVLHRTATARLSGIISATAIISMFVMIYRSALTPRAVISVRTSLRKS